MYKSKVCEKISKFQNLGTSWNLFFSENNWINSSVTYNEGNQWDEQEWELLLTISAFVLASPVVGAAIEHNLSLSQNTYISRNRYLCIAIFIAILLGSRFLRLGAQEDHALVWPFWSEDWPTGTSGWDALDRLPSATTKCIAICISTDGLIKRRSLNFRITK